MKKLLFITFAFSLFTFSLRGQAPSVNVWLPNFVESLEGTGLLTDLIACWEFTDGSGSSICYDAYTNSYDLTNNNTPTLNGTEIEYNGSNQYSYRGDNNDLDLTGQFSIATWFYVQTLNSNYDRGIVSKEQAGSNGWMIYLGTNLATGYWVKFFGYGLSTTAHEPTEFTFSFNTWTHCVISYDGTYVKMYKNGSLVYTSSELTGTITSSAKSLWFGRYNSVSSRYFDGKFRQTGIWARALTGDDVTTLYNMGSVLPYADFTASIKLLYDNLLERRYNIQTPIRIAS